MDNLILILWSSGSIDEARRVSRYLVQEQLIACANITPWVESIYMWNDTIETEQESRVTIKTKESLFESVKEIILKNSKYEVPEILKIKIDGGNETYLDWVSEVTTELTEQKG
jgi:periplasmic divalent cation tolerance protein